MNKSPTQWSKAFKTLAANSEDMVVNVQLTLDQLQELSIMMETLALNVDLDKIKEIVDIEQTYLNI
ncbi:hypothetical protein D3C80_1940550 [compost metagenome]